MSTIKEKEEKKEKSEEEEEESEEEFTKEIKISKINGVNFNKDRCLQNELIKESEENNLYTNFIQLILKKILQYFNMLLK